MIKNTSLFTDRGCKKRKTQMSKPIEMLIIRGQQIFDWHDVLKTVQIEINDDRL